MGGYLDTPKTDTESEEFSGEQFSYGASCMQGWRLAQEDAHNCCPDFDPDTNTSLFAVYDGHGGSEVAEYCSLHLPNFIQATEFYKQGKFSEALEHAFLAFDETIIQDSVIEQLKQLRGDENDTDDEDDGEMEELEKEKEMPLEQLMLRYGKKMMKSTAGYQPSPVIKPKKGAPVSAKDDEDGLKTNLSDQLTNGETGDDNATENGDSKTEKSSSDNGLEGGGDKLAESDSAVKCDGCATKNCEGDNSNADERMTTSSEEYVKKVNGDHSKEDTPSKSELKQLVEADDLDDEDSEDSEEEEDDEEEDDEDEDEEEEEELEEGEENLVWHTMGEDDTPGSDSGCTAVLALLMGRELYVANAGDSRCVVSRGGKSLDMSFDHKPEDEPERKRIEKAGGEVTPDGRVNNGLNLSRAIGDHCYKRNDTLPLKDQMITALPDVKSITLDETDEFMVLACDGIWNSLTSQEVVDFVKERLGNETKLSTICEELFEHCLAPDKCGDGTGCDNMTCIIVQFNKLNPSKNSSKRSAAKEEEEVPKKSPKKIREES